MALQRSFANFRGTARRTRLLGGARSRVLPAISLAYSQPFDRPRGDRLARFVVDTLGGVALGPDIGEPEANPKLDAELFAGVGAVIVVLVLVHRGRDVQQIARLPTLVTVLDFTVTLALQDVDHGFEVLMAAAVVIGGIFENERHRHTGCLEAVSRDDQVSSGVVLLLDRRQMFLRMVGLLGGCLFQMDYRAATSWQILRFLGWDGG